MAYIAATLNPEILKKFPGPVRVGKKKSGSGRVAGTRQGLIITITVIITTKSKGNTSPIWQLHPTVSLALGPQDIH